MNDQERIEKGNTASQPTPTPVIQPADREDIGAHNEGGSVQAASAKMKLGELHRDSFQAQFIEAKKMPAESAKAKYMALLMDPDTQPLEKALAFEELVALGVSIDISKASSRDTLLNAYRDVLKSPLFSMMLKEDDEYKLAVKARLYQLLFAGNSDDRHEAAKLLPAYGNEPSRSFFGTCVAKDAAELLQCIFEINCDPLGLQKIEDVSVDGVVVNEAEVQAQQIPQQGEKSFWSKDWDSFSLRPQAASSPNASASRDAQPLAANPPKPVGGSSRFSSNLAGHNAAALAANPAQENAGAPLAAPKPESVSSPV